MHNSDILQPLHAHRRPRGLRENFAFKVIKMMRFFADAFFKKRYGHRAVVIETVAAVPGMVGGMLLHLKCLRRLEHDREWIRKLLDEAENERMHLMTFLEIAKPNAFERFLIILAQFFVFSFYAFLYLISPKTAHRLVGYLEEEAIISYSEYLKEIKEGKIKNIKAPPLAVDYWQLNKDARLYDVVLSIREDERKHRDSNHKMADELERPGSS